MNLVHKTKLSRNFVIQHESQYKFLYDFVRNILSGKYADLMEAGVLSDNGFERLSSAELVEADYDEPKKMVSTLGHPGEFRVFRQNVIILGIFQSSPR